jgi:hypothetical protein
MSNTIRVQPLTTIETLDVIVQQYPVEISAQNRSNHSPCPSNFEQRTAFFIATQLSDLRCTLAAIFTFILLLAIAIAKLVFCARCYKQCGMDQRLAIWLIVQAVIAITMIILPVLLVIFQYQNFLNKI